MSIERVTVKDVMSIPIVSIKTNETVEDAISKLKNKGVHKAVIFDSQENTIGYTDVWKLGLLDQQNKTIENNLNSKMLIYSEISSVKQDVSLTEVMSKLLEKGMLLVIDNKGDKVGVVTPQDLRKVKDMGFKM